MGNPSPTKGWDDSDAAGDKPDRKTVPRPAVQSPFSDGSSTPASPPLPKKASPSWSKQEISQGEYVPGTVIGSLPTERVFTSSDTVSVGPSIPQSPGVSIAMGPPLEPCNITWRQAEGKPQTTAPLEQLPRGVRFPDDFPEPIQYDSAKKLLIYRGFMDTNSYRYLQKLSKDLDYIRAIDNLNTASAAVAAPSAVVAKPSRLGWWIAAAAGVIGVLAWMIVRFR